MFKLTETKMSKESGEIKKAIVQIYNQKAGTYGIERNEKFDEFLLEEIKHFTCSVKKIGKRVIDLGSGPGNESVLLENFGLQPLCVDISPRMIAECRKKGLDAYLMDFYNLALPTNSFHGVWMSFSLLHAPKKDVDKVISEIKRVLVCNGVFYVSLFEGNEEGFLRRNADLKRFGVKRYFSYYTQGELKNILTPHFEFTKEERLDMPPRPTISLECRKIN